MGLILLDSSFSMFDARLLIKIAVNAKAVLTIVR
jgi:hypothetical protein